MTLTIGDYEVNITAFDKRFNISPNDYDTGALLNNLSLRLYEARQLNHIEGNRARAKEAEQMARDISDALRKDKRRSP